LVGLWHLELQISKAFLTQGNLLFQDSSKTLLGLKVNINTNQPQNVKLAKVENRSQPILMHPLTIPLISSTSQSTAAIAYSPSILEQSQSS